MQPQYGQGAALSHHPPPYAPPEVSSQSANNGGSITSSLRQWRKKDYVDKQQPNGAEGITTSQSVSSTGGENASSHVARVAPHTYYPRPDVCHFQHQYADYSAPYKPVSTAPVKYSEIVETQPTTEHHVSPMIPPPKHKDKDFGDLCGGVTPQAQLKQYQGYSEPPPHLHHHHHQIHHQYMPKEPQIHPFMQKQPPPPHQYVQKDSYQQYLQPKYNMTPTQCPTSQSYSPENNFLARLNTLDPRLAQSIMNDAHLRDSPVLLDQNRPYSQPQRVYHHHTSPTPPHRNVSQPYNYLQPPYNYNGKSSVQMGDPFNRTGIPFQSNMSKYYPQLDQPRLTNISPPQPQPQRGYGDGMRINYSPMPPKMSPNYPNCSQVEYAQHYQNRRLQVPHPPPQGEYYAAAGYKPPEYVQNHLGEDTEQSGGGGARKSSLKQYLENWVDEEQVNMPEIVVSNGIAEVENMEGLKGAVEVAAASSKGGQHHQEPLYVLDTTEVSNENLPQFLHLQQVEKLPDNIRGYYHSADGISAPAARRIVVENNNSDATSSAGAAASCQVIKAGVAGSAVPKKPNLEKAYDGEQSLENKVVQIHIVEGPADEEEVAIAEREKSSTAGTPKNMPVIDEEVFAHAKEKNVSNLSVDSELEALKSLHSELETISISDQNNDSDLHSVTVGGGDEPKPPPESTKTDESITKTADELLDDIGDDAALFFGDAPKTIQIHEDVVVKPADDARHDAKDHNPKENCQSDEPKLDRAETDADELLAPIEEVLDSIDPPVTENQPAKEPDENSVVDGEEGGNLSPEEKPRKTDSYDGCDENVVFQINDTSVMLQIADELLEINVITQNGKKIISVKTFSDAVLMNGGSEDETTKIENNNYMDCLNNNNNHQHDDNGDGDDQNVEGVFKSLLENATKPEDDVKEEPPETLDKGEDEIVAADEVCFYNEEIVSSSTPVDPSATEQLKTNPRHALECLKVAPATADPPEKCDAARKVPKTKAALKFVESSSCTDNKQVKVKQEPTKPPTETKKQRHSSSKSNSRHDAKNNKTHTSDAQTTAVKSRPGKKKTAGEAPKTKAKTKSKQTSEIVASKEPPDDDHQTQKSLQDEENTRAVHGTTILRKDGASQNPTLKRAKGENKKRVKFWDEKDPPKEDETITVLVEEQTNAEKQSSAVLQVNRITSSTATRTTTKTDEWEENPGETKKVPENMCKRRLSLQEYNERKRTNSMTSFAANTSDLTSGLLNNITKAKHRDVPSPESPVLNVNFSNRTYSRPQPQPVPSVPPIRRQSEGNGPLLSDLIELKLPEVRRMSSCRRPHPPQTRDDIINNLGILDDHANALLRTNLSLMGRFLKRKRLSGDELLKVKEIIGYKRLLKHFSPLKDDDDNNSGGGGGGDDSKPEKGDEMKPRRARKRYGCLFSDDETDSGAKTVRLASPLYGEDGLFEMHFGNPCGPASVGDDEEAPPIENASEPRPALPSLLCDDGYTTSKSSGADGLFYHRTKYKCRKRVDGVENYSVSQVMKSDRNLTLVFKRNDPPTTITGDWKMQPVVRLIREPCIERQMKVQVDG